MRQRRILKNRRRVGEAIMIASGVGVAVLGLAMNVPPVSFGGLCILGLGIFSVFWR
ncbi:MAG TPA: hypothetical protein VJZ68_00530 [Nitrososphaera sp.]|uniref:hypothetical protein n=1 Tax=Nitrososphaera sp. TaxID=1971748 RepID=UPI002CFD5218|nr:hypothetical protein [Nitrososphaera sp.]